MSDLDILYDDWMSRRMNGERAFVVYEITTYDAYRKATRHRATIEWRKPTPKA